jgi:hypothetical protein
VSLISPSRWAAAGPISGEAQRSVFSSWRPGGAVGTTSAHQQAQVVASSSPINPPKRVFVSSCQAVPGELFAFLHSPFFSFLFSPLSLRYGRTSWQPRLSYVRIPRAFRALPTGSADRLEGGASRSASPATGSCTAGGCGHRGFHRGGNGRQGLKQHSILDMKKSTGGAVTDIVYGNQARG